MSNVNFKKQKYLFKNNIMKGYFSSTHLSEQEKQDILGKHRHLYNGYQTMQPEVSNTQPLYVQDFAKDKGGMVMNNKGTVSTYKNFGINEQVEEKQMCSECGSGYMEEGICNECGSGYMEEETGHLDDIYDEQDLDPTAGFDYIDGSSNDVDTFEGMHKDMYEQGGNADDMDVDDVEPAYNFDSNGPMAGGDTYPVNEDDFDELTAADAEIEGERDELDEYETMESAWNEEVDEQDISGVQGIYGDMDPAYDFDSEGPGKAGPYQHSQYNEGMAYVIGSDGKPRDKKPGEKISAFSLEDFDDDDYEEDELEVDFDTFDPREKSWEEITAHTGDDEFGGVDEDIKESLIGQKNRIMEMMNRMKIIK